MPWGEKKKNRNPPLDVTESISKKDSKLKGSILKQRWFFVKGQFHLHRSAWTGPGDAGKAPPERAAPPSTLQTKQVLYLGFLHRPPSSVHRKGRGYTRRYPARARPYPAWNSRLSPRAPSLQSFISENASAPLPSAFWEFAGSSVPRPPALRLPAVPRSRACQGLPCHPLSNRDRPPPSSHFFPTSSDLLVLSPPPSPPSPSLPALCCALRLFAHLKSFPPSAS